MYIWLFCAEHTFNRGAFSCTVCIQQSEYRSAFYREVQMIYYCFAVIGFCQFFYKNHFTHFVTLLTARSSI